MGGPVTRALTPAEPDVHERFTAWLLHGAAGEPARDLAVHATFCPECRAAMAALDLLSIIDTGRAPMPPSRGTLGPARRARLGLHRAAAAATMVIVAGGGWALASGRVPVPLAAGPPASQAPAQEVLGGAGGGPFSQPDASEPAAGPDGPDGADASVPAPIGPVSSDAADPPPGASPDATGGPQTATPTATVRPAPTGTPRPTRSPSPTPSPTARPTPTPAASALPPTQAPTAQPTPEQSVAAPAG